MRSEPRDMETIRCQRFKEVQCVLHQMRRIEVAIMCLLFFPLFSAAFRCDTVGLWKSWDLWSMSDVVRLISHHFSVSASATTAQSTLWQYSCMVKYFSFLFISVCINKQPSSSAIRWAINGWRRQRSEISFWILIFVSSQVVSPEAVCKLPSLMLQYISKTVPRQAAETAARPVGGLTWSPTVCGDGQHQYGCIQISRNSSKRRAHAGVERHRWYKIRPEAPRGGKNLRKLYAAQRRWRLYSRKMNTHWTTLQVTMQLLSFLLRHTMNIVEYSTVVRCLIDCKFLDATRSHECVSFWAVE